MRQDLTPDLLIMAYSQGYFPMPSPDGDEIHWYRPDPRCIIPLDGFHCSRSLERRLRTGGFSITIDECFGAVMLACADRRETWITDEFVRAYTALHRIGLAHSLEVWHGGALAGGVYGVTIGGAFFAESMFHKRTDASKVALFHLVKRLRERGFTLLECQFATDHLLSLGATPISDSRYMEYLTSALTTDVHFAD